MFHVVLILMALGFSLAAIAVMAIPLWLGPLLQLIVTIFCRKTVYLLIPFFLGGVMAVVSVVWLGRMIAPLYLVLYWCAYCLLLLMAFGVVRGIQNWLKQR